MSEIQIYTTNTCGYCHAAKDLLAKKGYDFQEVDVSRDPQTRQAASERAGGYRTVPMIFIGEHFVGGFTELAGLIKNNQLDPLVKS